MTERGPLDFEGEERAQQPLPPEQPRPAPSPPPPARPAGASRFTWVIGVAVLLVGVTIMLNALGGGGGDDDARPGGPQAGETLAPFAAPAADSDLEGDANVATKETVGEQAGRRPACEVRGADVVNICELYERGPVVLAVFPADAGRCRAVLRQFDRVRRDFAGRVTFAAVGSGKGREELRGHTFPVAYDHDGLVARIYGLASCPQITFARKGGVVRETTHEELTDAALRARVETLLR